jgi:RHS repeat-associated protein
VVAAVTLVPFLSATLFPAAALAREPDAAHRIDSSTGGEAQAAREIVESASATATRPSDAVDLSDRNRDPELHQAGATRQSVGLATGSPGRDAKGGDAHEADTSGVVGTGSDVSAPTPTPGVATSTATALPKGGADVSLQAIALPSGAATLSGLGESFSAQLTTGIGAFSVPFVIPRGRGNVQPTLGLAYSTSGGVGVAGVGWSLAGDVFIARQTDRGVPRYDDRADWHAEQDRFVFGTHELVPICTVVSGECSGALNEEVLPPWSDGWQYFRARVEGTYLRFFWSPDHLTWRIQSREGNNFELGMPLDGSSTSDALEVNPDAPGEIYRWHIARQYDSHGQPDAVPDPLPENLVTYRYTQEGGTAYLAHVFLTPPAADPRTTDLSSYAHHVALEYERRPDASVSYRSGWAIESGLRLALVSVATRPFEASMAAPRELVRRYHLDYEPGIHTTLLSALHLEGRCDEPIVESSSGELEPSDCPRLPAMTFEYQHVSGAPNSLLADSQGLAFEAFNEDVHQLENSPPHSLDEEMTTLLDVNSDGLQDVLVTAPALFGGAHGVFFGGLTPSGGSGFGSAERVGVTGVSGVDTNVLRFGNPNVAPLDMDADGRVDLVHMPAVRRYSVFSSQLGAGGWNWVGRPVTTASGQNAKINFTQDARRIAVMDVNADGLVDVVFSSATEIQTFFSLGRYPGGDGRFGHAVRTSPETADLFDDPVSACVPWSATPVRLGDDDVRVGDMNGDGLPDLVRLRSGQVMYWPGRGNGFWGSGVRDGCPAGTFGQTQHVLMQNAPRFGVAQGGSLLLSDVNGDGLSDVVEVRFNDVDIYLNDNAVNWTARHTLSDVPVRPNVQSPVRLVDMNGSTTVDVLWGQAREYRYVDLTGGIRPHLIKRTRNGLGKTTEYEYSTSARLMLEAARAGTAWSSAMPLVVPVVTRTTVRDNLNVLGRRGGSYTTEYAYRDPVYEGRQREFRGFRSAETRQVGDANSPTSTSRSTFLLGECEIAQNGLDVCSPADRWQDNWREALKGLPAVVETFDELGTYLSTTHSAYELRQLYAGRDGRRVSTAFPVAQDTLLYDAASFVPGSSSLSLPEVVVNAAGIAQTESRTITRRATQGTVRLRSERVFDGFGNQTLGIARGCIEGCAIPDDVVSLHASFTRPDGDTSGWLWRKTASFVDSVQHPNPRNQRSQIYDAHGDLSMLRATLGGTLPLDRVHADGATVAGAPPNASAGALAPVEIVEFEFQRDAFGNVTASKGAPDRCRSVEFDTDYAELAVGETVFGAAPGSGGCGERPFSTRAVYDRGFGLAVASEGVTGEPTRFDFDGFGRVIAIFRADPRNPGNLSALPASTYEYSLPLDADVSPYSSIHSRHQDGANADANEYHDTVTYLDGLGRTVFDVSEADPAAGDGGDFVVSGAVEYDARGRVSRAYENFFGTTSGFSLSRTPASRSMTMSYDAFGRPALSFGLDGKAKQLNLYHALSIDIWDAADLAPGPHAGTHVTALNDGHGRPVSLIERVRVASTVEQRQTISEFLPTGEVTRIVRRRAGSPDVVRWMRYDSLGRLVLNVEPNTSLGFTPDASSSPDAIRAWRYAYNDGGELVGTSDARGCGVNYHLDAAGRLLAEDYSPCESHHQPYTAPNFDDETGVEAMYRYDFPDPESGSIVDASGRALSIDSSALYGRLVSVSDRGSKSVVRYDALGRVDGVALRVAKPGPPSNDPASRYAPRWYVQETSFDALDRAVRQSTGATRTELLGSNGTSAIDFSYSRRTRLSSVGSSYGPLVTRHVQDADGLLTELSLGDGAATQRTLAYDEQRRLRSVQTYRAAAPFWSDPGYTPAGPEPTQQLLLEDYDFTYDPAGNVLRITDYRTAQDWPAAAKPVTRSFEYDDLYRLTKARYEYSAGFDSWQSPFHAEASNASTARDPAPHVAFDRRVLEQTYRYDHLGNVVQSRDDAAGFYDRSLGVQTHGSAGAGPHRLVGATNRTLSPSSTRKGNLEASYDGAGNLVDLVVARDGPCVRNEASCWQRYNYRWDEAGQLSAARRWDLRASAPDERTAHSSLSSPPPTRAPEAELEYMYDAAGSRVVKTARDASGNTSFDVYVFTTLELRRAWWTSEGGADPDYALTPQTEQVLLQGGGVRARVLVAEEDLPSRTSGQQHVFLELNDYLGSTGFSIDRDTGELAQYSTYQAYGGSDSDYRPDRWGNFREAYRFTGKEEDGEVGLAFFGKRYLSLGLGRWISADPVTIHHFRAGLNPYAYVHGRPTVAVDPDGGEPITLGIILTSVVVGFVIGTASNAGMQWYQKGSFDQIDWGDAVLYGGVPGAVGGGIGGAVGAGVGGLGGAILGGGASGLGSYLTTSLVTWTAPTWEGALLSTTIGAGAGAAGYGIAKGGQALFGPKSGGAPSPPGPASAVDDAAQTPPSSAAAQADDAAKTAANQAPPKAPTPKPTPTPQTTPTGPKAEITPEQGPIAPKPIEPKPVAALDRAEAEALCKAGGCNPKTPKDPNFRTTRVSGNTTYRFNTGHGFFRGHTGPGGVVKDFRNTPLAVDDIENAIVNELDQFRASGGSLPASGAGHYQGTTSVGGYGVGFRAVQLPNGVVSVGTYFPL